MSRIWLKSDAVLIFRYYNTQAEECLNKSSFNSKESFSEFFLKCDSRKMKKFAKKARKKIKSERWCFKQSSKILKNIFWKSF